MRLDDLHYSFQKIDGYNKSFNFVISEREDGKTTAFHVTKARKAFEEQGRPTVVLRRQSVDITEAYIDSIASILSKFGDDPKLRWNRGQMREGVVPVYTGDKVRYLIVSISLPMSRIKSLFVHDPAFFLFDEFIANTALGERYAKNEGFKIKEIYNTFYREASTLPKFYALGNPYSLYNPLFETFGIDSKKFKASPFVQSGEAVAEFHSLDPRLKEAILAKNPLYKFEDAYTRYALEGQAINDSNVWLMDARPNGYALDFAMRIEGKTLGIYRRNPLLEGDLPDYYVEELPPGTGSSRQVYCFEFADLMGGSRLVSATDRNRLAHFRLSVGRHAVAFKTLACDYLIEEIYSSL